VKLQRCIANLVSTKVSEDEQPTQIHIEDVKFRSGSIPLEIALALKQEETAKQRKFIDVCTLLQEGGGGGGAHERERELVHGTN
jgi:hypothetical protein